jgi:hypothetical protein
MQLITLPIDFLWGGGILQGEKFEQMQLITLPRDVFFMGGKDLQGGKFQQMQLITLPITTKYFLPSNIRFLNQNNEACTVTLSVSPKLNKK